MGAGADVGKDTRVAPIGAGRSERHLPNGGAVDDERAKCVVGARIPMAEPQAHGSRTGVGDVERHGSASACPPGKAAAASAVPCGEDQVVRGVLGLDWRAVLCPADEFASGEISPLQPEVRLVVPAGRERLADQAIERRVRQERLLLTGRLGCGEVVGARRDVVVLVPVDHVRRGVGGLGGVRELGHRDVIGMVRLVVVGQVLGLDADDVGHIRVHLLREVRRETCLRERRPIAQWRHRRDPAVPELDQGCVPRARVAETVCPTLGQPEELQRHPVIAGQREIQTDRPRGDVPYVGLTRHSGIGRFDAVLSRAHVAERVSSVPGGDEHRLNAATCSDVFLDVGIEEEEVVVVVCDHVQDSRRA